MAEDEDLYEQWQEQVRRARTYTCPVCDAAPGESCKRQTGTRTSKPHKDRLRMAKQ